MRSHFVLISTVVMIAAVLSGCGGPPANNNVNNVKLDTNNPINATTKPEVVTNNAPTLSPVFKAYCDAWVKNDEAALRKVYSAGTIKQFEDEMKVEKQKSLIKFLELEKVSGTPCQVTNETITGDKAIATIISNKYPRGIQIEFLREDGEWKLTNSAPTLSAPPTNANAAK